MSQWNKQALQRAGQNFKCLEAFKFGKIQEFKISSINKAERLTYSAGQTYTHNPKTLLLKVVMPIYGE